MVCWCEHCFTCWRILPIFCFQSSQNECKTTPFIFTDSHEILNTFCRKSLKLRHRQLDWSSMLKHMKQHEGLIQKVILKVTQCSKFLKNSCLPHRRTHPTCRFEVKLDNLRTWSRTEAERQKLCPFFTQTMNLRVGFAECFVMTWICFCNIIHLFDGRKWWKRVEE